jgi:hypothetical protein
MNFNISFEERAKLSTTILSKQPAVTIEEARKQVPWLKTNTIKKKKEIDYKKI